MLKQIFFNNITKFLPRLFVNGLKKEKSNLLNSLTLVDDYTICKTFESILVQINSILPQQINETSATLVSHQVIKKKILNVKSSTSIPNSLTTKSSKTLVPVSTGKEKVWKPFWNKSCQILSDKLWLPTMIDLQDSALNSFNGSVKNLIAKSWFSINLQQPIQKLNSQKTYLASLPILPPKITVCDLPKTERIEILRSKKIKLYPTNLQRQKLRDWFGSSRWVYNKCVQHIKDSNQLPTRKILRNLFVNGDDKKLHSKNVPYEVRDSGLVDALKNLKSNFAKIKNKSIRKFQLQFRSIKTSCNTISIRHRDYNHIKGAYSFLREIKKSENIRATQVTHDFRILKDTNGEYWMCLPITKYAHSERQARVFSSERLDGTISLDPGVRTFLVGYDAQNRYVLHIGKDATTRIEYVCTRLDSLISKHAKCKSHKKRRGLKKAQQKKRKQIKNLVADMHFKMANFLCSNYKTILLPSFETQKMVENGKLKSKVARNMMTLSHYTFRQRLLNKCVEYVNCKVEIVNESYTSKTCGNCGNVNEELGSSKTYNCEKCKIRIDRDANGSRNILLKNI